MHFTQNQSHYFSNAPRIIANAIMSNTSYDCDKCHYAKNQVQKLATTVNCTSTYIETIYFLHCIQKLCAIRF